VPVTASADIQDIHVDASRKYAQTQGICERLVDLDEGFAEWRYRHVRMVERTIGVKPGTGGSAGAAYLRTTLGQNLFPDLWEIRSRL
jgi:tryptophan 2,3-dioxygenase